MPRIRVNAILPKNLTSSTAHFNAVTGKVLNYLRKMGTNVVRPMFEETVETWEHKPRFVSSAGTKGKELSVVVKLADEPDFSNREDPSAIWTYVNYGTKGGYTIPVGPDHDQLWMPSLWSPKTRPGRIKARPGIRYGMHPTGLTEVTHPGIEARDFIGAIRKRVQEEIKWTGELQYLINEQARKSGLSMR